MGSGVIKETLKENELVYLHKMDRNIHSIEALEDSAFLDILIPSYDNINRFCNFYDLVESN